MGPHSGNFRAALEALDLRALREMWILSMPNMPQPRNDTEALVIAHMARTQSASMPLRVRAYSHRWLLDHGYPSQLPDRLRPKAERIYPKVVSAVGISVNFSDKALRPVAKLIEGAMCDAVEDCYANGDTEPEIVSRRMSEAREQARSSIFGKIGLDKLGDHLRHPRKR